jgi:hypothetical protein
LLIIDSINGKLIIKLPTIAKTSTIKVVAKVVKVGVNTKDIPFGFVPKSFTQGLVHSTL